MEKLVDRGLAHCIGVSNFNAQLLMDLQRYARIPPATLQIEHHPYLTQPSLIQYAQDSGIHVTAYSSFGPTSFLELNVKRAVGTPPLLEHDLVKKVAEKHGKTPAQVLLRWATQRGIAVIPKSNNQHRLQQNLDVTGWDLDDEDISAISGLDKGLRFNEPPAVGLLLTLMNCIDGC
jgi:D-xylose reductase